MPNPFGRFGGFGIFGTFDSVGQVVDTQSAQEFMREAMAKISPEDLDAMEREVAVKSARFQRQLSPEVLGVLPSADLQATLKKIFAVRRRVPKIFSERGDARVRREIRDLLYGDAPIPARFQSFCDAFDDVDENMRYDFASEILHYTRPDEYWLWTRWIWDPEVETGALRLVTLDEFDFHARSFGETYMKVGEAIAFTSATGDAAGFTRIGDGRFGVDVFLACVYGVYTYTILRMRMTQEFNNVMPPLPELARRLLGVWEKRDEKLEAVNAS